MWAAVACRAPMVHPKMAQMTSALIAVLMVASAQAQTAPAPIDATYRFTVGGAPVVDATLWLYNEETLWPGSRRAWHRPKRRQHDSPDASMIESIDSHGDANVYWVALHVEDDNHHLVSDNDGYVQFLAPFTRMVLHVEHYARQRNAAGVTCSSW